MQNNLYFFPNAKYSYLFITCDSQQLFVEFFVNTKRLLSIGQQVFFEMVKLRAACTELVLNCVENLNIQTMELKQHNIVLQLSWVKLLMIKMLKHFSKKLSVGKLMIVDRKIFCNPLNK